MLQNPLPMSQAPSSNAGPDIPVAAIEQRQSAALDLVGLTGHGTRKAGGAS